MINLIIGGRNYTFYNITGKVADSSKINQQHLKTVGGGPYTTGQQTMSINIVHDQIFLIDNNGKEYSCQLIGMNVACREGNELTITCVKEEGKDKEMYVAAFNRTTNQLFFSQRQINTIHLPSRTTKYYFMGALFLLILIASGYIWAAIPFGLFFCWMFSMVYVVFKGPMDGKKFTANFRIEDYN